MVPNWGRRRRAEEPGGEPDATFPFLTEPQAQRVRELARRSFAEHGVEVVVHAEYLQGADGQRFGLSNLAAAVRMAEGGERRWPALVDEHVERILRIMSNQVSVADLDRDEVLKRVYLRLQDCDGLPPDRFGYARPVCGNMIEVIAFDSPESVSILSDADVTLVGLDCLRDAGLTNLLTDQLGEHEVLDGPQGTRFHLVTGESVYTASKLLVLRDVLRRTLGEREYPHGVLAAAPFRHQLVFAPVDDEVLATATLLAHYAESGYGDGVAPLSPFAYWWDDGRLQQISFLDDDGRPAVRVTGAFEQMLERLFNDPL